MEQLDWPPDRVVIRTPMLELRLPTDHEWCDLMAHSNESIYERSGIYPFLMDWVGKPYESMQFRWRTKADWKPESWQFPACVFVDGEICGVQDIGSTQFGVKRSVTTGSWLKASAQGRGIGTEMRIAILHFAFAGLGALEAHSEAHVDNQASNAISRSLGYEFTHIERGSFAGQPADQWKMIMRHTDWVANPVHQRNDIDIAGLDGVRDWFGADQP